MNKIFKDHMSRQIAAIRDMLFSIREVTGNTVGYGNVEELERALFEAINAFIDFEVIFERINENKGGITNEHKRL